MRKNPWKHRPRLAWALTGSRPTGQPTFIAAHSNATGTQLIAGSNLTGGLLLNPKTGVLYGTVGGGSQGYGQICELRPPAAPGGAWTKRAFHSFDNTDPRYPFVNPVFGAGGALYGPTVGGGTQFCMCGTVLAAPCSLLRPGPSCSSPSPRS